MANTDIVNATAKFRGGVKFKTYYCVKSLFTAKTDTLPTFKPTFLAAECQISPCETLILCDCSEKKLKKVIIWLGKQKIIHIMT